MSTRPTVLTHTRNTVVKTARNASTSGKDQRD